VLLEANKLKPDLDQLLRVVGESVRMTSPLLVTHIDNPICDSGDITKILNSALTALDTHPRELLNIKIF
jgi:hypothetical protein